MGLYSLRKIFEYAYRIIIFLTFLALIVFAILFIFVSSVKAEVIDSTFVGANGSHFSSADIINIENTFNTHRGSYDSYVCTYYPLDGYSYMYLFNKSDTDILSHYEYTIYLYNNEVCQFKRLKLLGNSQVEVMNETTGVFNASFWQYPNSTPSIYGNVGIYDYNNLNRFYWIPDNFSLVTFNAPYIQNFENAENIAQTESGNFTFFIVRPGSVPMGEPMELAIYNFSDNYNGDNPVISYTLDENSVWFEDIDGINYRYILVARFLDWFKLIDGNKYRLLLAYYDNNSNYHDIIYDLTLNIDSETEKIIEDTTQQDISQGINNINSFITDNTIEHNTVIEYLPDYDFSQWNSYYSPIDVLFSKLFQMFTGQGETANNDFVFTFPNGTEIVISPSYIEEHCPTVIVGLIRVFYWYIIGRYIVKSVMRDVDKFRQGTFLEAEEDIKTEVL